MMRTIVKENVHATRDIAKKGKKMGFSSFQEEFKKSPVASNIVFIFILAGLEKLVEMDFVCPCNPECNVLFSAAFFIIPAFMAFVLMLGMEGTFLSPSIFVPPMAWLILMFLDGQYFACARTTWEGRFVIMDNTSTMMWCEPVNKTELSLNNARDKLMHDSQQDFVTSQMIGMSLTFILTLTSVGPILYILIKKLKQDKKKKEEGKAELNEEDAVKGLILYTIKEGCGQDRENHGAHGADIGRSPFGLPERTFTAQYCQYKKV